MGKTSDDPDLFNRTRSWVKRATQGDTPPGLPTHDRASTTIATSDKAKNHNGSQTGPTTSPDGVYEKSDGLHSGALGAEGFESNRRPADDTSGALPPPAPPPLGSKDEGTSDSSVGSDKKKGPLIQRARAGIIRFGKHTQKALTHSWINVLLIFVPIGIAMDVTGQTPTIVFAINAVAIIPLAGLLVYATESVAIRLGDTLGALLNVSFGNAVELIIYIIALTKGEIRIVQASLLGSILSNLLLIMGMAFLFGGLRFQEQIYNNTVTQMSACLLSLSVGSLLLPTAFYASFLDTGLAKENTLKISRATSVILLIVYVLYLLFQLKTHAYLYESTPQHVIDEESHPGLLNDIFDSSSSSDSSDSSSSSDTDTSGSHTTTKRIKRAFRNRRRRKSSVSSINTTSVPSIISSPSFERTPSVIDTSQLTFATPSRRPSALATVGSGDEADNENAGQPRIRDFVDGLHEEAAKDRSRKKKHKKHHKKHRKHHLDDKVVEEGTTSRKQEKRPSKEKIDLNPPRIEVTDDVEMTQIGQTSAPRRGLVWTRPALPKMLTQNVFLTAPSNSTGKSPSPSPAPARTGGPALRRTNSLPDRLNRRAPSPLPHRQFPMYPHSHPVVHASKKEDEDGEEEEAMSRTASAVLLLVTTGLVAVCAEFLVSAIPGMIDASPVSQEFVGLIILPIVSNAAEHFTAVTVATKNKMDLSIGVSVGSSIQIALFVTPLIVILGWIIGQPMTLFFNLFETLSIFVTVFVVNFLVLDGRSNYLEGSLLCAAYTIIAVASFFYPDSEGQSAIVGGS
ncbi:Vacuolar calcium ion transporter [Elsinoe australis]|uniref:Vacuolar calcium ion transporter n=1 Tax=Elsinoe australis TaxID=40998 RepID=A0A2P8A5T0_9PEZI|nr:Vacuolar calcium ion transporter [Elsinoe australis]